MYAFLPQSARTTSQMRRLLLIPACLALAVALPSSAGAAMPGGFVGMTSEGTFFAGSSDRAADFSAQHRAGVRLLRQTFDCSQIELRPGAYDWAAHDKLVLSAARNGIAVMPVLFNPPAWHSSRPPSGGARGTYPPSDPASMARFAAAAVARYGPGGSLWRQNPGAPARPIRAWQVWNEPTLPVYWGGRPDARAYVRLLKAVNGAIKRLDRRAEVVTAGLPPSILAGAVPVKKYVDQMYRAGGKKAFDTLAINTYARSAGELGRLLRSVRKIMNRHGDRRAKIWITELGWCDKGPKHRFCVGKRRQVSLIRSSLQLIREERRKLRLRGLVYFSWRDSRPYAPDFRDQWGLHTGLLKLNGRAKPSLRAFRRGVRPFR